MDSSNIAERNNVIQGLQTRIEHGETASRKFKAEAGNLNEQLSKANELISDLNYKRQDRSPDLSRLKYQYHHLQERSREVLEKYKTCEKDLESMKKDSEIFKLKYEKYKEYYLKSEDARRRERDGHRQASERLGEVDQQLARVRLERDELRGQAAVVTTAVVARSASRDREQISQLERQLVEARGALDNERQNSSLSVQAINSQRLAYESIIKSLDEKLAVFVAQHNANASSCAELMRELGRIENDFLEHTTSSNTERDRNQMMKIPYLLTGNNDPTSFGRQTSNYPNPTLFLPPPIQRERFEPCPSTTSRTTSTDPNPEPRLEPPNVNRPPLSSSSTPTGAVLDPRQRHHSNSSNRLSSSSPSPPPPPPTTTKDPKPRLLPGEVRGKDIIRRMQQSNYPLGPPEIVTRVEQEPILSGCSNKRTEPADCSSGNDSKESGVEPSRKKVRKEGR